MNWESIDREAARLGIHRIASTSLRLTEELFGQPIPMGFQAAAHSGAVQRIVARVIGRLEIAQQPDTDSIRYFREVVELRERASDRGRFLARLLTTPSIGEWETIRLPAPLFPLYRVVRLFRLLRRLA